MTVQPGEWLCSPGNDCTAWGITVQPAEWLYSLRNDITAREWLYSLGKTVQPREWLYSPGINCTARERLYSSGNDCTAWGMTVQPREWLYSPRNDCIAQGMTVQPEEWLYTICCTTEKISQCAKLHSAVVVSLRYTICNPWQWLYTSPIPELHWHMNSTHPTYVPTATQCTTDWAVVGHVNEQWKGPHNVCMYVEWIPHSMR